MRTVHILLLFMLGAALLTSVACNSAIGPDDCCFTFFPRRLQAKFIKSYYMTDTRCPKIGVIFVSQKSRHICVDSNLQWVQRIMASLDERTL